MNTSRFNIFKTSIDGLILIQRKPIFDKRGFFERLYCFEELKEIINGKNIIQINHSYTKLKGTIRGMHFQKEPYSEMKIVLCLRGKIFDVAIDLRKDKSTFLNYHAEILSEENNYMFIIPEGFAHGFQTMSDQVEMIYFHYTPYSIKHEFRINPFDPIVNIKWPLQVAEISDADKNAPFIDESHKGILL